jgi:hypothetical protein
VFLCDARQQSGRDVFLDKSFKRSGTEEARRQEGREASPTQQALRLTIRIGFGEFVIPIRPQKRVWGGERARAHPGNDIELWPVAPLGPPDEQTGAVGAVGSAAGKRENGASMIALSQSIPEVFSDPIQPHRIARPDPGILCGDQSAPKLLEGDLGRSLDGRARADGKDACRHSQGGERPGPPEQSQRVMLRTVTRIELALPGGVP